MEVSEGEALDERAGVLAEVDARAAVHQRAIQPRLLHAVALACSGGGIASVSVRSVALAHDLRCPCLAYEPSVAKMKDTEQ